MAAQSRKSPSGAFYRPNRETLSAVELTAVELSGEEPVIASAVSRESLDRFFGLGVLGLGRVAKGANGEQPNRSASRLSPELVEDLTGLFSPLAHVDRAAEDD